jgi:hypothetical protein
VRACERELSAAKAEGVRLLIVSLTGKACPCDRGLICPMFPAAQAELEPADPGEVA